MIENAQTCVQIPTRTSRQTCRLHGAKGDRYRLPGAKVDATWNIEAERRIKISTRSVAWPRRRCDPRTRAKFDDTPNRIGEHFSHEPTPATHGATVTGYHATLSKFVGDARDGNYMPHLVLRGNFVLNLRARIYHRLKDTRK